MPIAFPDVFWRILRLLDVVVSASPSFPSSSEAPSDVRERFVPRLRIFFRAPFLLVSSSSLELPEEYSSGLYANASTPSRLLRLTTCCLEAVIAGEGGGRFCEALAGGWSTLSRFTGSPISLSSDNQLSESELDDEMLCLFDCPLRVWKLDAVETESPLERGGLTGDRLEAWLW